MANRIVQFVKRSGWEPTVEKNTIDILEENGVEGTEIEAIIWRYGHITVTVLCSFHHLPLPIPIPNP